MSPDPHRRAVWGPGGSGRAAAKPPQAHTGQNRHAYFHFRTVPACPLHRGDRRAAFRRRDRSVAGAPACDRTARAPTRRPVGQRTRVAAVSVPAQCPTAPPPPSPARHVMGRQTRGHFTCRATPAAAEQTAAVTTCQLTRSAASVITSRMPLEERHINIIHARCGRKQHGMHVLGDLLARLITRSALQRISANAHVPSRHSVVASAISQCDIHAAMAIYTSSQIWCDQLFEVLEYPYLIQFSTYAVACDITHRFGET